MLEELCSTDETVIRDQAVKSLVKISSALSDTDIQGAFASMVVRLSSMETLPSRLSAIGLVTCCYKRAGAQKETLRE